MDAVPKRHPLWTGYPPFLATVGDRVLKQEMSSRLERWKLMQAIFTKVALQTFQVTPRHPVGHDVEHGNLSLARLQITSCD